MTALMVAAGKDFPAIVVELLKLGADAKIAVGGFTAEQIALKFGARDVARILQDWVKGIQASPNLVGWFHS